MSLGTLLALLAKDLPQSPKVWPVGSPAAGGAGDWMAIVQFMPLIVGEMEGPRTGVLGPSLQ